MDKLIRKFNDLTHLTDATSVACLDSGGLDSAFLICNIAAQYNDVTIHVLTLEIGQEDALPVALPQQVENRIIRHKIDAKDDFAENFVLPLLFANGVYAKQHPLSASLSRPLIAKYLVELANRLNITTVLHAATPSQNSMRRFNGAIKDLNYTGFFGSPYLEDNYSRVYKLKYLERAGGQSSQSRKFSIDSNLFCREFESGTLKNPESISPPEEMFLWTRKQERKTQEVSLEFKNGKLIKLNEQKLTLRTAIEELNIIVGSHGIGRYQGLEENSSGQKVLEIREAPAAHILLSAYNELLNATQPHDVILAKSLLEQLWTKEASEGRWYGILKKSIDEFNNVIMNQISGKIIYLLKEGSYNCISVVAENPLYSIDRDQLDITISEVAEKIAA